jgi:hypothetical protein
MPMSLEQIFSGVGVDTARRLARVGRMIEQQQKFDSAVATGFKRPNNYRNALGELSVQLTNAPTPTRFGLSRCFAADFEIAAPDQGGRTGGCLLQCLAQSGHHGRADPCPLSGVKRT